MASEGEFPKVDGDVLYASEVNYLNQSNEGFIFSQTPTNSLITSYCFYMPNTSTVYITSYKSTDGGQTFYTGSDSPFIYSSVYRYIYPCLENPNACMLWSTAQVCRILQTDGTLTVSSTIPNKDTAYDGSSISFPSLNRAYLSVATTAGASQFYSTDSGLNWIQSSTGTGSINGLFSCIGALEGNTSTAYGIDINLNLWKTTNGGINWITTGWTMIDRNIEPFRNTNGISHMYTLGDDAFLYIPNNGVTTGARYLIYFTAGTEYVKYYNNEYQFGGDNLGLPNSRIIKVGTSLYCMMGNQLICSTDSGLNWKIKKSVEKNYLSSCLYGGSICGFEGTPNKLFVQTGPYTIQKLLDI